MTKKKNNNNNNKTRGAFLYQPTTKEIGRAHVRRTPKSGEKSVKRASSAQDESGEAFVVIACAPVSRRRTSSSSSRRHSADAPHRCRRAVDGETR